MRFSYFGILALTLGFCNFAQAQEPFVPRRQDKPPGPALSPQDAIAKMTVPEGFTVELVASEPEIQNPVAMTFDERGRIWITESFEYPRFEAGPGRDRIKILEDTNGDGYTDLVCRVNPGDLKAAGVTAATTTLSLTGLMADGTDFFSQDAVKVVTRGPRS